MCSSDLLNADAIIWPLRFGEFWWQARAIKPSQPADKDKKRVISQAKEKKIKDSARKESPNSKERMRAEITLTRPRQKSVVQPKDLSIRINVQDTYKTLTILPSTTCADAIESVIQKLVKGKYTDENLAATKEQYRDFWLFASHGIYRDPNLPIRARFPPTIQSLTLLIVIDSWDTAEVEQKLKATDILWHIMSLVPQPILTFKGGKFHSHTAV